jgi:hypothetical protein
MKNPAQSTVRTRNQKATRVMATSPIGRTLSGQ